MEIHEILEGKDKLIDFLKEKGFSQEKEYFDEEYNKGVYFKIADKKLLVIYEVFKESEIKEVKDHFLIDMGLNYCVLVFGRKLLFSRNFGDTKYFIYSDRTQNQISKIDKLKNLKTLDSLFQSKDISGLFYEAFKLKRNLLVQNIKNDVESTQKYLIAQKIFDRLFFIYFLCHKDIIKFKDGGKISGETLFTKILLKNGDFLTNLKNLFSLFNSQDKNLFEVGGYQMFIPYLNGGLFRPDVLELDLKVTLKEEQWEEIFEFLNSYHWIIEDIKATEENEDKILTPEILGHVYERSVVEWEQKGFEEEAEEAVKKITERKKKGVYYTPESITDYISNNTIIPYLLDKLSNKYTSFNELIESKNKKDMKEALKVLNGIKVLDPACGSGAFLIKAAEVVFRLKRQLYYELKNKQNIYNLKLNIITGNIYGVDILAGAIEISKLRLWLWLISDYDSKSKVEPLPNIEYNLIEGNSLIGFTEFKGKLVETEHKVKEKTERFEKLKEEYKKSHGKKSEIIKELIEKEMRLVRSDLNDIFIQELNIVGVNNIRIKKMNQFNFIGEHVSEIKNIMYKEEFEQELKPFHWILEFSEVFKGENPGFDVILANPPYVSKHSKENNSEYSEAIIFTYYKTAYRDSDLYCYFFERSNNLTNNIGYISMITSNTFFVSVFGSPLRAILASSEIKSIIDFKEFEVFEDASNYVQIIIYKNKVPNKDNIFFCAKPLNYNPDGVFNEFSQNVESIEYSLREKLISNQHIKKSLCSFRFKQSDLYNKILLDKNSEYKLIEYSTTKGCKINKRVPVSDIWVLLPERLFKVYTKIEDSTLNKLGDCEIIKKSQIIKNLIPTSEGIFVGIQTSADNVYILKTNENINITNWEKKNKITVHSQRSISEFEIETKILKAFVKPEMLSKYSFTWEKTFVIFPYDSNAKLISLDLLKKESPLAFDYLSSEETLQKMKEESKDRENLLEKLMKFTKTKNYKELSRELSRLKIIIPENYWWYKYIYPKNLISVSRPKILTKTVSNENSFSLDIDGVVAPHNVGVYSIPLKDNFYSILGLLNSKVCQFYLTSFLPDKRGGYYLFIKEYLSRIPILIKSSDKVELIVKEIIEKTVNKQDITAFEKKLNELIYNIYDLTVEEIKIVEDFCQKN